MSEGEASGVGVRFSQRRVILDDWWLCGGTPWGRMRFRLKHPIIYSKRGMRNLWRRLKLLFIKEKKYPICRKRRQKLMSNVRGGGGK